MATVATGNSTRNISVPVPVGEKYQEEKNEQEVRTRYPPFCTPAQPYPYFANFIHLISIIKYWVWHPLWQTLDAKYTRNPVPLGTLIYLTQYCSYTKPSKALQYVAGMPLSWTYDEIPATDKLLTSMVPVSLSIVPDRLQLKRKRAKFTSSTCSIPYTTHTYTHDTRMNTCIEVRMRAFETCETQWPHSSPKRTVLCVRLKLFRWKSCWVTSVASIPMTLSSMWCAVLMGARVLLGPFLACILTFTVVIL